MAFDGPILPPESRWRVPVSTRDRGHSGRL